MKKQLRKYDEFEAYALIKQKEILSWLECENGDVKMLDKPDIRINGNAIGIEVTSALLEHQHRANTIFIRKINGKQHDELPKTYEWVGPILTTTLSFDENNHSKTEYIEQLFDIIKDRLSDKSEKFKTYENTDKRGVYIKTHFVTDDFEFIKRKIECVLSVYLSEYDFFLFYAQDSNAILGYKGHEWSVFKFDNIAEITRDAFRTTEDDIECR